LAETDLKGILGRKATLTVQSHRRALPRYFSGLVIEVASHAGDNGSVMTSVLLLPELCRLESGCRYRIFQGLSVPNIVQMIFCEYEISDVVWQLAGSYPPRPFCMQYNESDFAFVQRILGEEGIFYYFVHRNEGYYQLVLCNKMQNVPDCPGQIRLDYSVGHPAQGGDICCFSLVRYCRIRQGGVNASRQSSLSGKADDILCWIDLVSPLGGFAFFNSADRRGKYRCRFSGRQSGSVDYHCA